MGVHVPGIIKIQFVYLIASHVAILYLTNLR